MSLHYPTDPKVGGETERDGEYWCLMDPFRDPCNAWGKVCWDVSPKRAGVVAHVGKTFSWLYGKRCESNEMLLSLLRSFADTVRLMLEQANKLVRTLV